MTLPDFHQFEPLNRLKEQMGIPRDHYGAFPQTSHKPRAWILLKSGRRLDLLDPQPDAWTDKDLAIGISRTYRWGGTCVTASASRSILSTRTLSPSHPACSHGSPGRRSSLKHCSCSGLLNF